MFLFILTTVEIAVHTGLKMDEYAMHGLPELS